MRTTIAFDDDLLRQLKAEAARQGETLSTLVNDLLRQALIRRAAPAEFLLELAGWEAETLPGVDIMDRDQLFDLMNGR